MLIVTLIKVVIITILHIYYCTWNAVVRVYIAFHGYLCSCVCSTANAMEMSQLFRASPQP